MNEKLLKIIFANKEKFIPLIFTSKQFLVLEKYFHHQELINAEKKALYTAITKKVQALETIFPKTGENLFINGSQYILPARIKQTQEIIKQFPGEKVFVAGSFLFSKKYNDIDIYILKERGYKEIYEEEKHYIYLTKKKLSEAVFQSASLISVANFQVNFNTSSKTKPKIFLKQLMSIYHEAVIEILQKESKKEVLRELIFSYYLICQKKLLNAIEIQEIIKKIKIKQIDLMAKELCKKLFSKTYLYVELHEYIKTLNQTIQNIQPNAHLQHYKNTYEELIYGRTTTSAEIN